MRCSVIFTLVLSVTSVLAGRGRGEISWGAVSNSCQIGVSIQPEFNASGDSVNRTVIYLGTTNGVRKAYYCPPERLRFSAVLRDSKGNVVTKTSLGKKFGGNPQQSAALKDIRLRGDESWKFLTVPEEWNVQVTNFNVMEHFKLEVPGDYTLTIAVRLYKKGANGELELVMLAPISARFQYY